MYNKTIMTSTSSSDFSRLSKSSKSINYLTPKPFFDKLNSIFHFKCDPAADCNNNLGLDYFFTEDNDGLSQKWLHNSFINPPFGKGIDDWILKMQMECAANFQNIYVMLLPARTDTRWFQDLIWNDKEIECGRIAVIHFIKGRLKFVNPDLNPKQQSHITGSMLWILGSYSVKQIQELNMKIPGITIRDEISEYNQTYRKE